LAGRAGKCHAGEEWEKDDHRMRAHDRTAEDTFNPIHDNWRVLFLFVAKYLMGN
jgi:hypothetical protein